MLNGWLYLDRLPYVGIDDNQKVGHVAIVIPAKPNGCTNHGSQNGKT